MRIVEGEDAAAGSSAGGFICGSLLRRSSGFLSKDSFYLLIEQYRKFSLLHQKDRLDRVAEWPLDFDFRRHFRDRPGPSQRIHRAVSLFPAHAALEATSTTVVRIRSRPMSDKLSFPQKILRLCSRLREPEWRKYGALLLSGKLAGLAVLLTG